MKTAACIHSVNGHARKEPFRGIPGRPFKTIFQAIDKHAAIYLCLAAFFASCWAAHHAALAIMEDFHRRFAVMNDRTVYAMRLIDCVAANWRTATAYAALIVSAVAFAQYRRHPAWSTWLTALLLCLPCALYCWKCLYIVGKCSAF